MTELGDIESLALLAQTDRTEQLGGMKTANGFRRRTPGGTFFQLGRKALSPEQRRVGFISYAAWLRRETRAALG